MTCASDHEHWSSRTMTLLHNVEGRRRGPDRKGKVQGFKYSPRRAQCGAHADRRRKHRDGRWSSTGHQVRERAQCVRSPDRKNQGVSFRLAAHISMSSREPDALQGLRAVRQSPAVRRRSEHGELPRRTPRGSGERMPQFHGGFGFCDRVRTVERKFARRGCIRLHRSRRT